MAACAFSSATRHEAEPLRRRRARLPRAPLVSQGSVSQRWNSVATRLGSAHLPPRVDDDHPRTRPRAASETYSPSARESHGVPSITTVSGSGGFVRTIASAAAIVPATLLPERGSARTGHPSRSASASTRSGRGASARPAADDDDPPATERLHRAAGDARARRRRPCADRGVAAAVPVTRSAARGTRG